MRIEQGIPITEATRFSKFFKSPLDLLEWHTHFLNTGIQSVIVLTDEGYALYRVDMVDVDDWGHRMLESCN